MRVLALETSGMSGSVATLEVGREPCVTRLPDEQRSARGLAPAVRTALELAGWRRGEKLDLLAVTVGPGSFTGLRIGVVTAKALAYAWQAQLIGVDTLDVLAHQATAAETAGRFSAASCRVLHTVLDAHRQELFHAQFRRDESGRWRRDTASGLVGIDAWTASLAEGAAVIGPALKKPASRLPPGVVRFPDELGEPHAGAVAETAVELFQSGRRDDPFQLTPQYGRLAAAEEKRLAAKGAS